MWCQHCGQDVPAQRPTTSDATAPAPTECSRCGRPVGQAQAVADKGSEVAAAKTTTLDDSQLDRRLRHIGRSLRTPVGATRASTGESPSLLRIDAVPATPTKARLHTANEQLESRRVGRAQRASQQRTQLVAWFALAVGLGLAAAGVGLMGMGMFGEHPIFWQWGVGVTLAGQAILIGGLVRVLLSLWHSTRAASRRLAEMQQELAGVGRTTEAIIAQRPGGASGFYGELARGASPVLLLANLKGQIDHLATTLHHDA